MVLLDNGIHTVEDWFRIAPPKMGASQWVDGRSAKELAKYIVASKGNVPDEIDKIIPAELQGDGKFDWFAEKITDFDESFGSGEGRHHDMVMMNDLVVVGIEAKADEPLDKPVGAWVNGDNRTKRINAMCNLIFGRDYKPEIDDKLRYQLFSGLAGLLVEARNNDIESAIFVILTIKVKGHYDDKNIERNENDIAKFLSQKELEYDKKTGRIRSYSKVKNIYIKHITIER